MYETQKGSHKKSIKGLSEEYLSPNDVAFIEHLISTNFKNVWQSYMHAFPESSESNAKSHGYRKLKAPHIEKEIQARIKASRVTEADIVEKAMQFIDMGLTDPKASLPAVKALEMLAKYRGMLDPTQRQSEINDKNPAVFLAVLSKEEFDQEMSKRTEIGRISE